MHAVVLTEHGYFKAEAKEALFAYEIEASLKTDV